MVVAVVVDDLAVDAHILDPAVLVHDDVVVRLPIGHAAGKDVGGTVVVLVPVHDLAVDVAHAALVLAVGSHVELLFGVRRRKGYSPRSGASQAWWLQVRHWLSLVAKADIYQ